MLAKSLPNWLIFDSIYVTMHTIQLFGVQECNNVHVTVLSNRAVTPGLSAPGIEGAFLFRGLGGGVSRAIDSI